MLNLGAPMSNIFKIKEKDQVNEPSCTDHHLQRDLSNRHIQLIAIGGAIGTGLFMGSGKTIASSGTSIIITYMIIGFFLFFMMRAMGELLLSDLKHRSFSDFCTLYIGKWAGYFIGWSYWLTWVVVAIADCVVISEYLRLWLPDIPAWIPSFGTLFILMSLNLVAVKIFGEMEFWFSLIKVIAIISMIFIGLSLIYMNFTSPSGVKASLTNLTDRSVFLPHGIMGFFAGFQIAIFSFAGIELIGTTAAETKNPKVSLPRAINSVPVRIMIFYILALSLIISVSSWPEIAPEKSPFVQLFILAGLPAAAGIINLVVITSAMSAANSGVFATSRMLYGLSAHGLGLKCFSKLSNSSTPVNGLIFSVCCMAAGLGILFVIPSVMTAFTILSTISAVLYIFVWAMILMAYLIYRNKRPDLHQISEFKMPFGKLMSCLCLLFFMAVIGMLLLEPDTRDALLMMPIWFALLFVSYQRHRFHQKRNGATINTSLN